MPAQLMTGLVCAPRIAAQAEAMPPAANRIIGTFQSRYDAVVLSRLFSVPLRSRLCLVVFALACAHAAQPPLTTVMYLVNRPASIASFQAHWQLVSIIAPQCFTM